MGRNCLLVSFRKERHAIRVISADRNRWEKFSVNVNLVFRWRVERVSGISYVKWFERIY